MRLLPLFIILILMTACGKNSGSSGTSAQLEDDGCTSADCNTITTDENGVELLDSVIDVPVTILGSQITFGASKSSVDQGDRISCKTSVSAGEVYHYSLKGNKLSLKTSGGNYTMSRLNGDDGIIGTWTVRGRGDQGMFLMRTLSVVNERRVILRTHCEL